MSRTIVKVDDDSNKNWFGVSVTIYELQLVGEQETGIKPVMAQIPSNEFFSWARIKAIESFIDRQYSSLELICNVRLEY